MAIGIRLRGATVVPQERQLTLNDTGFFLGKRRYSYFDVEHISFYHAVTQKTLNYAKAGVDHSIKVKLYIKNLRDPLVITAGPQYPTLLGFNFGEEASNSLIDKISEIQKRTFEQRLGPYLLSIQQSGYFFYDGKKIETNGDVHHPRRVVNLRGEGVRLWKYPFQLVQKVKGGGVLGINKNYYFDTKVDTDVFFFLLDKLFDARW